MIKGGYKIIDFKGAELTTTAVEISGIYNQIVDDYNKPIMISGANISGELQDDAYASVKVTDESVTLTVYGGVITVTEEDEVTFESEPTTGDLKRNLITSEVKILEITEQVPANTAKRYQVDIAKAGYTPIGILGIAFTNDESKLIIKEFSHSGSTANIWVYNVTDTATGTLSDVRVTVLYKEA